MQKGFSAILVLLVLASLIIGGVFAWTKFSTPQKLTTPAIKTTPNSNLTYTNPGLGFQFSYPADLIVKEDSEEQFNKRNKGDFRKNFLGYVQYEPGKLLGAISVLSKDQNFNQAPLSLWIFNNPDNLTVDQWYNKYWYYPFVWGDFSSDTKNKAAPKDEMKIASQSGKSAVLDYQPGKPKFIYIPHSGKMFLFKVLDGGGQVLDSFKFTDLAYKTDNWKTYKNKRYKYQFNYPQDWYLWSVYPQNSKPQEEFDTVYLSTADPDKAGLTVTGVPEGVKVEATKFEKGFTTEKYVNEVVIPQNNQLLNHLDQPKGSYKKEKVNDSVDIMVVYGLNNATGIGNIGPDAFVLKDDTLIQFVANVTGTNNFNSANNPALEKREYKEEVFKKILKSLSFN